jgi:enediyne biosynthesis protein E4
MHRLVSACAAALLGLIATAARAAGPPSFADGTAAAALDFIHDSGASGRLLLPEIMGSGVALFDMDGDGDLDVYLVQGGPLPGSVPAAPRVDRLLRNDLVIAEDGSRTLRFTDVTAASGLTLPGHGMGVAAGDYDNDGRIDLFVTSLGPDALLHNDGGGRFSDRTLQAGFRDLRWSTSAAFFDADRDGWLDLFVVGYVDFQPASSPECFGPSSAPDYCGPGAYPALSSRFYRNRKDGTFEDRTAAAGIAAATGAGLGVVTADLDGDGWMDVYVANDGGPNHLWLNGRDGTFREAALWSGLAVNRSGAPEAGMGIAAGDFDGDGDEDLFLTHLTGETSTLYVNQGGGLFEDRTAELGLGAASLPFTGFGTGWLDLDGDGWLDLLCVNGAVRLEHASAGHESSGLGQPDQLFRNTRGRFALEPAGSAAPLAVRAASRGAAFGDIDGDGDTDVLIVDNGAPARLLLNVAGSRQHWLGLRLLDRSGRDALGALIEVLREGQPRLVRRVRTDGSYLSASDPRVLFGLGADARPQGVRVQWPDGSIERWHDLPVSRYTTLRQGSSTEQD